VCEPALLVPQLRRVRIQWLTSPVMRASECAPALAPEGFFVTLRRKTLLIIGATLLGLLVTFFVLTRVTLLRRLREYEAQQTRREVQRASTALETEISQLETIARDDAVWDETYEFVQRPHPRFLESNFPRGIFTDLRIDLVMFLNSSGEVIFERLADHPLDLTRQVALEKKLLQPGVLIRPALAENIVSGIITLSDGPMMISASRILKSSGEGPSRGTLIMGRRLSANEIHRLSLLTRLDLQVYPFTDPRLPADFQAIQGSLSRLTPIVTRPLSKQLIAGYELINGVDGQPALMLRVRLPRTIYAEGRNTEIYLMGSALIVGLVFSVVTVFLLERLVLSRLVGLGKNVAVIGSGGDLSARVAIEGSDELSQLARVINRMLADLERAEQERRRDEERYRAYVTQSTEGIWRCELQEPLSTSLPEAEQMDHLHRTIFFAECNDALARLHGFASAGDLRGRPVRDLFEISEPENLELARKLLRSGYQVVNGESIERDEHGHARYFLNNINGVVEDGFLVRVWGTQREVTEQRRLEAQLLHAQKMEAIGRLAGGVAHDFNNLLSVIHGYTEILLRRFSAENPARREAERVLHATERAALLTQQLLALGRKQVLAPRVLDLNSVLRDMDRVLPRLVREDIELVIRKEAELWRVRADPAQMEQVIVNLAVNARDAMASGGRLTLETKNVELDHSLLRRDPSLPPGRYVVLTVSDTGIGMDAETRAKIFEPFFTTKEIGKGTGLGLATVYGIVQQSGGHISVDSEPGKGSTFRVYLPQSEGRLESLAEIPTLEPAPKGSGTLLLVEDDVAVRGLAREVLQEQGYTVLSAGSGEEAIQVVENREGAIDLMVSDVIMPGMAGDELVEHLRLRLPGLKVVFVSGYASDSIPKIVTDSRTCFLQKPFPVQELVRKVHEMLVAK